jgi:type II secretory pathway predicted ATPase ExeA
MALVLDWQKKLGYAKDPFDSMMLPASRFLVGMHELQERLNLFLIKEERFGTISGEHGTGKTLLLQWMNEELAPQKSHLQQLLDGKMKRDEIVNTLLETRLSFFEKKLGGKLKLPDDERERELLQRLAKEAKNVLLIDNAGSLGRHEVELLAEIGVKTPTYIIIADTEERLKKLQLPESLIDRLKLRTPQLTGEQLADLLQRRIEAVGASGTFPFDDEELKGLIKRADRNPAKLLALGRERAIELSLKVGPAAAPSAPQAKSTSFFSIKVAKVDKSKAGSAGQGGNATKAGADAALPQSAGSDVDMLAKVIETSEHPAPAQPATPVAAKAPEHEIAEPIIVEKHEHGIEHHVERTSAHERKPERKSEHKAKPDNEFEHLVEEFSKKAPSAHTKATHVQAKRKVKR